MPPGRLHLIRKAQAEDTHLQKRWGRLAQPFVLTCAPPSLAVKDGLILPVEETLAEVHLLVCTGHCAVVVGDALGPPHAIELRAWSSRVSPPLIRHGRPSALKGLQRRIHPAGASNARHLCCVASSSSLTHTHASRHALPKTREGVS